MSHAMKLSALAAFLVLLSASTSAPAAQWHVATTGTAGGAGTAESPWDLQTALAHPADVKPGDTIWLHGGVYAPEAGLTSSLRGTEKSPIVVRQALGERVILDGRNTKANLLTMGGRWTWYWGFEITSTVCNEDSGGGGGVYIGNSAELDGTGVRLINLIIHDTTSVGVGFWVHSVDSEMSGCLIYYCGTNYNLDHGLYTQNRQGTRRIADNIIFRNKSFGIHAYGSEKAYLEGFHFEGNILFDSGALRDSPGPNFLVGGGRAADRIVFQNNYTWHARNVGTGALFGYGMDVTNGTFTGVKNVLVGGSPMLRIRRWQSMTFRENRLVSQGDSPLISLETSGTHPTGWNVDLNNYYAANTALPFRDANESLSLDAWRKATGFDANSTQAARPAENWVYLRPNQYEKNRANLVIYNWTGQPTVAVNLSKVLSVGQGFELRDAQNYFGPPALQGKYAGGTVAVPMTGTAVAKPIVATDPNRPIVHSPKEFGAFALLPVDATASSMPTVGSQPATRAAE